MRTSGEGSVEERRQRPTRLAATFRTFRKRGISRVSERFRFFFFSCGAYANWANEACMCVFM